MPKKKPAKKAVAKVVQSPGASTDPAVHQLLAERQTAALNGDKAGMTAVDHRLRALGYDV
jgi:hypothetical protein